MKKRILRRTFYTFFSIILLYTLMIIATVTLFNFNHFSQQNDYKNQVFLDAASRTTDSKINSVARYASAVSKQPSVQDYISNSNSSLFYFPDIYDDLVNSLYLTDDLNIDVGITKVSDNYVVSQEGYFPLADYLNQIGISKDLITAPHLFERDQINNFYLLEEKFYQNQNNTIFISQTYYHQLDEYLYIFISIPNEKLFPKELANISGTFYLDDNKRSTEEITTVKQSESFEKLTKNHTKDSKILYNIPSSVVNLQYSYLVVETKFLQFEPDSLSVLLLFALCLFLLGGIILYFATIKSYNPIQDILNAFNKNMPMPFKNHVKDNSVSELDYIIRNIDGIQDKNKELEHKINESLSVLQVEFISSVLFGTINKEEIPHKLTELSMEKYNRGGIIAIISIASPELESENVSNTNLLVLRNKVITLINSVSNDLPFIQIPMDYKDLCFIFPSKEAKKVEDQLNKLTSYIQNELSIKLTHSISEPVESIYNFNTAFIEAIELTLKKYTYVNSIDLFPAIEPLLNDESYSYSLDDERFLVNAIIDNDFELAGKLIQNVLETNLFLLELDTINTIKFKYVLLNTVKRILNHYNKSINEFSLQNKGLFDLLNSNNKDDIYFSLNKIFDILFQTFIITFKETSDPTTLRILEYINQNFDQDLSLTDISIKFNLTEGYISRVLKKNANINFKKHLNNLKINKAKELLKNGNYKVNEVSALVGYKNVNTFIRTFKQQEGIPPGEFSKFR
ncbi:helix-turn-helix transcriptional regulator [Oceanobacillus chungangensis]|uniref:HTH araC/xylS-type domain-containing protein n=1 Tax=Oceanobacillus chungangensis TaxID=1229152 RepID=A0A3D8PJL7_9BACI|nr:AraC family transcriptional regulator [Oceanobacillus chungangensis]RDW15421.1 hypothetical protein CWR45_16675 [Oceanobacillus chungangensis]